MPTNSCDRIGAKTHLLCYSLVDAVDLPAAECAADVLAPINAPQNGSLTEFGGISPLLYREYRLAPQGQVAAARFLIHLTLAQQDAVTHFFTEACGH